MFFILTLPLRHRITSQDQSQKWTLLSCLNPAVRYRTVPQKAYWHKYITYLVTREFYSSFICIQGPPAPTSPLINKYIYTLLRSQYVSNGCKNNKVGALGLLPIACRNAIEYLQNKLRYYLTGTLRNLFLICLSSEWGF